MDTLRIVKDSFHTLRQNRSLWFFGFFVAGAGGAGGRASHSGGGHTPSTLGIVLAVAAVAAIAVFVMQVVSEGALIDGVRRSRRGDKYSLGAGFRAGARFFWRVLGIKLAALLTALLTVAIAAIPLIAVRIAGGPLWAGALGTVPLMLVFTPWLLSVYFVYEFSLRAAVVDDDGVKRAISRGFAFLQGRLALSLWLTLASGVGQFVAGLAGLVVLVPIALVGGLVYLAAGIVPAAIVAGALLAPIAACLVGALGTYRSSVWTHGYLLGRAESV